MIVFILIFFFCRSPNDLVFDSPVVFIVVLVLSWSLCSLALVLQIWQIAVHLELRSSYTSKGSLSLSKAFSFPAKNFEFLLLKGIKSLIQHRQQICSFIWSHYHYDCVSGISIFILSFLQLPQKIYT